MRIVEITPDYSVSPQIAVGDVADGGRDLFREVLANDSADVIGLDESGQVGEGSRARVFHGYRLAGQPSAETTRRCPRRGSDARGGRTTTCSTMGGVPA